MKNSANFWHLQRTVFQHCLSILIGPVRDQPDIYLAIQQKVQLFRLRISMIIADMAEANKFTNVYQPASSKRPCYSCLVSKADLNNLLLPMLNYRTPTLMKQAIFMDVASEHSIHIEDNIFWEIRYN